MIFVKDREPTELCRIGAKYNTNKSPLIMDHYTLFYYDLLKDKRETIKKFLEVGIGYPEVMPLPNYKIGASLFMWREFLPNTIIYGADIEPRTMFESERIKTILCDERNPESVKNLIDQVGSDVEFVVDDALHFPIDQVNLCLYMMPLLNKDVTYIIEDVPNPAFIEERLEGIYNYEAVRFQHKRFNHERLLIVKHK